MSERSSSSDINSLIFLCKTDFLFLFLFLGKRKTQSLALVIKAQIELLNSVTGVLSSSSVPSSFVNQLEMKTNISVAQNNFCPLDDFYNLE